MHLWSTQQTQLIFFFVFSLFYVTSIACFASKNKALITHLDLCYAISIIKNKRIKYFFYSNVRILCIQPYDILLERRTMNCRAISIYQKITLRFLRIIRIKFPHLWLNPLISYTPAYIRWKTDYWKLKMSTIKFTVMHKHIHIQFF